MGATTTTTKAYTSDRMENAKEQATVWLKDAKERTNVTSELE